MQFYDIRNSCASLDMEVVCSVKNLPAIQETQVQSLGQEDPLEEDKTTTPIFLPGESHEEWSLEVYSP